VTNAARLLSMTDQSATIDQPSRASDPAADGFAALGLDARLLDTLVALGYEEPTPIQREAIPPLLAGRDVLAEAPTGTGKTASFALPLLQRLTARPSDGAAKRRKLAVLVLVPTRELAMQVSEAIHRYGERMSLRVLPLYGGQPIGIQLRAMERGVDIIVATPGRAVDHLTRGSLVLSDVEVVILDEADEMLDMGFADDLDALLSATPSERQTALFSATISPPIARIARRHLREPERITIEREHGTDDGIARVRQVAYVVRRADKLAALGRILDIESPSSTLIFGRTRMEVGELADRLSGRGREAAALHGGMTQEQRDRVMGRFRSGDLDVLVATDVAARGLDIEHVSHVVNYDVPADPDAYIHRIGRTGRAGREGVAITFVEPREHRLLRNIERAVQRRLELGRIPTVADLRERRLDLLRGDLREALLGAGFDRFRAVVEPLTEEFDIVDIALAAVSLAERPASADDEGRDIATASLHEPAPARPSRAGPERDGGRRGMPRKRDRTGRRPDQRPSARPPTRAMGGSDGWATLFVGGGRRIGLRPTDLVGAITGETGLPGSSIGAIQIADSHSLVEVPEGDVDDVARVLSSTKVRGRRLEVRRERGR
jgi:ATP-dependent RNA helicase DeaD